MDTTGGQLTVPSSSSLSPPSCNWDVFLSFHGKDTRRNFVANLYFALDQAGTLPFRDDPALEKGEQISSGLLNAIKDSKMFVVVLSENYARSSWCLDELVEILSLNRTENEVLPVFYYVDPTDLRYQKGSFGDALEKHKERCSVDRIDKWKHALAKIAELSGYHLKKNANENESDTIQKIVENVASQSSTKVLHLETYLYGIDSAVEDIYQKLRMKSNDVRVVGMCGMGGIGKTTIAKALYNKYSNHFGMSCFIENVKQNPDGGIQVLPLLKQLLSELLRRKDYMVRNVESGIRQLQRVLSFKKALVVLDNLHQSSHSDFLVRLCNMFAARSRIIITTREVNLLNQLKVDILEVDIYMVKKLGQVDSLQLFSYHAFRKSVPPESFKDLSVRFATYAGGLPLALKVLGSSLRGRTDMSFWKAKLEKVREIPENDIQRVLRLSYDELGDKSEKATFLDIVFFFVGKDKDESALIFKSCNYFPDVEIITLIERCLLTIDEDNKFQMHNLIQEMGRNVIREESEHGKCKRLYLGEENAYKALQNMEGTDKVEGLILDLTMWTKKHLSAKIFKRLPNLRLLEIIDAKDIKGDFENSFYELRCIRWHHCPWTCLPSSFRPQKLVSLDMPFSKFRTLWKNPKPIKQLNNLGSLDLNHCCNLKLLPEQLGEMKGLKMLDASFTAIEQLPDSISQLRGLVKLAVHNCKKLKRLPEKFGNLEGLRIFDASCSAIEQLPDSFVGLINLVDLTLIFCKNLTSLPNNIWKLKSLKVLDLGFCPKLKRLPDKLGNMQSLEVLSASGSVIQEFPDSIGQLSRLNVLELSGCHELKYLPSGIWNLTSLTQLHIDRINMPDMVIQNMNLEYLSLTCNLRLWLPAILSFTSLKQLDLIDEEGQSLSEPVSLSKLSNLESLTLNSSTSPGSSFPELPSNLTDLRLKDHATLEQLPDLSYLNQLNTLILRRYISLQSLPPLPPHLQTLLVRECTSLQDVPGLSVLKELQVLSFEGCSNLNSVSLEESFFQIRGDDLSVSFKADIPNREIPEWFSYKSSGCTVSLDVPLSMGDDFLGVALWIVYKVVYTCTGSEEHLPSYIKAVITNNTEGITNEYEIDAPTDDNVGEVLSRVQCIQAEEISVKSGDEIEVSIGRFIYTDYDGVEVPDGEIMVDKCGVHVIQKTPSTIY